jgi:hypothetical protein
MYKVIYLSDKLPNQCYDTTKHTTSEIISSTMLIDWSMAVNLILVEIRIVITVLFLFKFATVLVSYLFSELSSSSSTLYSKFVHFLQTCSNSWLWSHGRYFLAKNAFSSFGFDMIWVPLNWRLAVVPFHTHYRLCVFLIV